MAQSSPSKVGRLKIINGALDEVTIDGKPTIVLRGVVDPESLRDILVEEYQREILSREKIDRLKKALRRSRVPDIDLGVRGEQYEDDGGTFWISDPVYVVDGLQRITAAMELLEEGLRVHLGALISFNTNEAWEQERFEDLNLGQTKLSPNVTLRNQAKKCTSAALLLQLANAPKFPLRNRITWTQAARRDELITATTYFAIAGALHSHLGPGRAKNVIALCAGLDKIVDKTTQQVFAENILAFYDIIEECWGVRRVVYRGGAIYLRASFLRALALLLSRHTNFWQGNRLIVDKVVLRKLRNYPIDDPHVQGLSSSSGQASEMLYQLLVEHVKKGRPSVQLIRRDQADHPAADLDDSEGE